MEILKEDLELKITNNVLLRYITQTKCNSRVSRELLELKLKRNWILGKLIEIDDDYETRNYGNLTLERSVEDNVLTRIYNYNNQIKCYHEDIKENEKYKKQVEDELGITKLKDNQEIELDGYIITRRCYKNYIFDYKSYIEYKELLQKCINIIQHGKYIRSYNDKVVYESNDGQTLVTITNRKNIKEITNIIERMVK